MVWILSSKFMELWETLFRVAQTPSTRAAGDTYVVFTTCNNFDFSVVRSFIVIASGWAIGPSIESVELQIGGFRSLKDWLGSDIGPVPNPQMPGIWVQFWPNYGHMEGQPRTQAPLSPWADPLSAASLSLVNGWCLFYQSMRFQTTVDL